MSGRAARRDVRLWLHARSAAVSANPDIALLRAAYSHADIVRLVRD